MRDKFFFLAFATIFLFFVVAAAFSPSTRCRCTAGDPCFPIAAQWEDFNLTVGGALLHVRPPASPCYGSTPDTAQCAAAQSNWSDPFWRADQPGAAQHPNWEAYRTEKCPLPPRGTARNPAVLCGRGSVPVLAVDVRSVSHVQETLRFAAQHFLRVVVRNTGHDYLGRSFGRGSITLWMHNLKTIEFEEEFLEFGCQGSSISPAVEVGAGVQWKELYTAADQHGKVVVGGLTASVSTAGGYLQGGGHGPLSPTYGLAVDNVLQFTVVTPDGTARYANRCVNRDLFWALRGGGGGTFAVVTAAVYRTHPAPKNVLAVLLVVAASDEESYRELMVEFARLSTALYRAGWAGYFHMSDTTLILRYLVLDQASEFYEESFGPFLQWIEQHSDTVRTVSGGMQTYTTFLEWYSTVMCSFYPSDTCNDDVGTNRVLISRLVPVSVLENSGSEITDAILRLMRSNATDNAVLGIAVTGSASATVAADDAAVNPAWRKTIWHVVAESSWNDSSPSIPATPSSFCFSDPIEPELQERMDRLTAANAELRQLTPGSGAYFNEADYNEPDWQQSLFGDHYQRLLEIKAKVDPHGLLVCWHCVGSEAWSKDLNCPKC